MRRGRGYASLMQQTLISILAGLIAAIVAAALIRFCFDALGVGQRK